MDLSESRLRALRVNLFVGDLLTALVWMGLVQLAFALPIPRGGRAAAALAVLAAFLVFALRPSRGVQAAARRRRFRFVRPRAGVAARLLPAALALTALQAGVYALASPGDPPGTIAWLAVLHAVVIAPLIEEAVFRGSLQQRLERQWGPQRAVWGIAALFALLHLSPETLPVHLLTGVVYGYAAYLAGSVWPAVLLHAASNLGLQMLVPIQDRIGEIPALQAAGLVCAALALLGALVHGLLATPPPPPSDTRFYARRPWAHRKQT